MIENHSIIIDTGSLFTRVGISNQKLPQNIFPTVIGVPNIAGIIFGLDNKDAFFGKDAIKKKAILSLYNPIQKGFIVNWENMQILIEHIFHDKLRILPDDYPCLLTEPIYNTKINREKTAQVMFNLFNIPYLFLENQQVLSLYGYGLNTGTVIDSASSQTFVTPIYEGSAIYNKIQCLEFAGNNLTQFLYLLLEQQNITKNIDHQLMNEIKEKICYVAFDYEQELKQNKQSEYILPDGQSLKLNQQQFTCLESFFNPSLIGIQQDGIQKLTYQAICQGDTSTEIQKNILLSGGSSLFPGFKKRLQKELKVLSKQLNNTEIIESDNRLILPWIGGQILSELSTFKSICISKQQYEEYGDNIINKFIF